MKSRPLWALFASLLLAGCSDGSSGPSTPSSSVEITPGAATELLVGDDVALTATVTGPASLLQWTSRDPNVATVEAGGVEALRPGSTWIVVSVGDAMDSVSVAVVPRPGGYTAEEVDYFLEIAFGFEFGGASQIIRKWPDDITIQVNGSPGAADLEVLNEVIFEINALTATSDMALVDDLQLVELHFALTTQFPDILSSYVPGNVGYFSLWWDGTQHFTRAVILIATDVGQGVRNHIIREEVTQSLGLAQDSFKHPESIFYQAFSTVDRYASVDEAVIEMLYRPEVEVAMDRATAGRVVRKLTRLGSAASPPRLLAARRPVSGFPGSGSGSGGGGRIPQRTPWDGARP